MKGKRFLLVILLMAAVSTMSWAQKFEVMPFAGYRTSGSFDVTSLGYARFTIKDGLAYGLTLGFMPSQHAEIEFMWSRTDSDLVGNLVATPAVDQQVFKLHTDQYHVNFLAMFPKPYARLVPYLLFGLGATYAKPPDAGGETRLSWALGGGLKVMAGERLGLRFQAKWTPTYIHTKTGGIWCDWWGYCYAIPIDEYMSQGEFTGGIFFRF
jgi:hypothetical protein